MNVGHSQGRDIALCGRQRRHLHGRMDTAEGFESLKDSTI
jgi:hypothetical protein